MISLAVGVVGLVAFHVFFFLFRPLYGAVGLLAFEEERETHYLR